MKWGEEVETHMKKKYQKPAVESEAVFETLAAGCGLLNPADDINCDPDAGLGPINQSG
jgi:hypothetical protein